MTVTVWQFLFNDILFQGNVKSERAAIPRFDISVSEIYVINIHNRDFWVLWIVRCVIFILKDCKIRDIGYGSCSQTFSAPGALSASAVFSRCPWAKRNI
jgi:hypothetical protein